MPTRKKKRRHGKPQKAVRVTTYQRLEEYLRAFAAGHFHLVILVGAGGLGKSRSVRYVLGGKCCWIEGNATPFGMYVTRAAGSHQTRDAKFLSLREGTTISAQRASANRLNNTRRRI